MAPSLWETQGGDAGNEAWTRHRTQRPHPWARAENTRKQELRQVLKPPRSQQRCPLRPKHGNNLVPVKR